MRIRLWNNVIRSFDDYGDCDDRDDHGGCGDQDDRDGHDVYHVLRRDKHATLHAKEHCFRKQLVLGDLRM